MSLLQAPGRLSYTIETLSQTQDLDELCWVDNVLKPLLGSECGVAHLQIPVLGRLRQRSIVNPRPVLTKFIFSENACVSKAKTTNKNKAFSFYP